MGNALRRWIAKLLRRKVDGVVLGTRNKKSCVMRTKRSMVFCFAVLVTGLTAQSEEFSMKVMTYNIYRGGTMRGQPLSQTANVIREAKADVVGVQHAALMGRSWRSC